jgi:uncharacterized protein YqiB (DUF1249 family)
MSLYESNYLKLIALLGLPATWPARASSFVPGDCELRLTTQSRSPFTSELLLTYVLPVSTIGAQQSLTVPDMLLRVYQDARLVEALPGPARQDRELRQSWGRNMMLNKWLEYCVERGHGFS